MKTSLLLALLLAGCVSTKDVYLADGSKGVNISCNGTLQNFGACLQRAGEICGTRGYEVYNKEGEIIPSATLISSQGNTIGTAGAAASRSLFVKCKA